MVNPHPPTLDELLAALASAVRRGDLSQARRLEQVILQRLATEAADRAAVERQVRELLTPLAAPTLPPELADPFDVERGLSIESSIPAQGIRPLAH